ncbi:MAG: aminodeoxychorismate lyase [Bacteroidota bacterium]|nr:aminodeoxychorismate lyase [Bacteroidota bacterium]
MEKKFSPYSFLLFLFTISLLLLFYFFLFADNINNDPLSKSRVLYIHTGSNYDSVSSTLKREHILKNRSTFTFLAKTFHYRQHILPGRYLIPNNSGNLYLIRKLRSGRQDPVKITFNNIQNKSELIEKVSSKLEATKEDLLNEFNDQHVLDSLHLTEESFPTIFLANTYEFYWNTSAGQFINRMLKEYDRFWTAARKAKAQSHGLSPAEITILASIIQKESNQYSEYPVIAGVYLNRLKRGMPLQADPTVVFALNEMGQKHRIYKNDLKIQSPYNTYINRGLPPGPICLPELKSIDKTLDAQNHNYMYFCARDDFSGYSVFAATWEQHLENARRYQKALNQHNIH